MSDLHHILPTFSTKQFSHIIPSLERSKVTVNDLLTLDALEIADHAKVPILDVARLRKEVISTLHGELGLTSNLGTAHLGTTSNGLGTASLGQLRKNGKGFLEEERFISTLDEALDKTLGGGIPTGYLSEVTGERYRSSLSCLSSFLSPSSIFP